MWGRGPPNAKTIKKSLCVLYCTRCVRATTPNHSELKAPPHPTPPRSPMLDIHLTEFQCRILAMVTDNPKASPLNNNSLVSSCCSRTIHDEYIHSLGRAPDSSLKAVDKDGERSFTIGDHKGK